jgi:glyoxylase I family protein
MNKVLPIKSYHHVALVAKDFDKSVAFYEKLGFTKYLSWSNDKGKIQLMDIGNGEYLEIFSWGTAEEPQNPKFVHIAFAVADVQVAYDAAINAGAESRRAPVVVQLDSEPRKGAINCAFVAGPDGEELEFFKELI